MRRRERIYSTSRRDDGHITRESLNARSGQRASSDGGFAGFVLEQSMKLGPLIRVRAGRFEGGLEKKLTKLAAIHSL